MAKHSRRHSRKHRTHRRKQRGGNSVPGSTGGDPMKAMMAQSLAQGQQFASMHAQQHGGAVLDAGAYPTAVTEQALLPPNLMNAARVAPLNAALTAIANMKDPGQAGGGKRKGRKGAKKSRKGRKASRKGRKSRKASRKSRKTRRQRGGAAYDSNPASVNAPGLLLDPSQMTKALSGMNAEWKLAENPAAFAPGVAKNY